MDTNDGATDKTAKGGGEQMNLQNQPAQRNEPNQHRAHT